MEIVSAIFYSLQMNPNTSSIVRRKKKKGKTEGREDGRKERKKKSTF